MTKLTLLGMKCLIAKNVKKYVLTKKKSLVVLTSGLFTVTVTGATFGATDLIRIYIRNSLRAYNSTADALKTAENKPLDQRSILATWLAVGTALTKNTTYYYPASTYLDTHSGNANAGKIKNLSVTGRFTTKNEANSTVTVTFEGTNDSAKTAGYEAPFQFFNNSIGAGAWVNNVVVPINTVSPGVQFAFDLEKINYRYIRMKVVVGNCASDLAAEQGILANYEWD